MLKKLLYGHFSLESLHAQTAKICKGMGRNLIEVNEPKLGIYLSAGKMVEVFMV